MSTYVPDVDRYQQLEQGDRFGSVNCTAYGAAFRCDFHTKGAIKTTGAAVRSHSNEPIPDPGSPGLNLGQVDNAVIEITNGKVDFDTRAQSRALSRAEIRNRVVDGRAAGLSVMRGVLVNRGWGGGSSFTGAHDITVFTRETEPDVPILFDSLVPRLQRISWDAAFDAAEALTGAIYAQFTRDLTPDYHAVIVPTPPANTRPFYRYLLDDMGQIRGSQLVSTGGIDKDCSVPRYHPSTTSGISGRYLVMFTEGAHKGWYVNAKFAKERNP